MTRPLHALIRRLIVEAIWAAESATIAEDVEAWQQQIDQVERWQQANQRD